MFWMVFAGYIASSVYWVTIITPSTIMQLRLQVGSHPPPPKEPHSTGGRSGGTFFNLKTWNLREESRIRAKHQVRGV